MNQSVGGQGIHDNTYLVCAIYFVLLGDSEAIVLVEYYRLDVRLPVLGESLGHRDRKVIESGYRGMRQAQGWIGKQTENIQRAGKI